MVGSVVGWTRTGTGEPPLESLDAFKRSGKAGARLETRSQETDLIVLVTAIAPPRRGVRLLRNEKDETSPARGSGANSSNAFIPRLAESEGLFLYPPFSLPLVSQS
jgi:hypothetical protein